VEVSEPLIGNESVTGATVQQPHKHGWVINGLDLRNVLSSPISHEQRQPNGRECAIEDASVIAVGSSKLWRRCFVENFW